MHGRSQAVRLPKASGCPGTACACGVSSAASCSSRSSPISILGSPSSTASPTRLSWRTGAASRRCPMRRSCSSDLPPRHQRRCRAAEEPPRRRCASGCGGQSSGRGVCGPSVALFELWYGVARSRHRERNAERLHLFLSGDVAAIAFGEQDAPVAGELRRTLEAAGTPIGAYHLLIAAQALRAGATLVTANVVEFARVPGWVWEDWTAAG